MTESTQHGVRARYFVIGGAILAVVVGTSWYTGHKEAADARARAAAIPTIPVTMAPAKHANVDVTLEALGTVVSEAMVTLTSRVTGTLTEVLYKEGQRVKRNDVLAVIDPSPYQAALLQAQGQLARDQALLSNARIDLERYRKAYLEHAVPEQQFASQQASVDADEGVVKLDQGTLDAAAVNVAYTRIVSPIDGRAGLRMVDPGNIVSANGTSGLVTIAQIEPITVVFTLSQDFLPAVSKAIASGRTLRVVAFDRAQKTPVAEGELLTIDNQVDPTTGSFRLKAAFANKDEALWPGEFVSVRLVTEVEENAVTVPARAVQSGPNGSFLFIVRPDSTVEMRSVEVDRIEKDVAVIRKGLKDGERIVVDGQYRLEQGSKVVEQAPGTGN